jgi:hypothetical protein
MSWTLFVASLRADGVKRCFQGLPIVVAELFGGCRGADLQ